MLASWAFSMFTSSLEAVSLRDDVNMLKAQLASISTQLDGLSTAAPALRKGYDKGTLLASQEPFACWRDDLTASTTLYVRKDITSQSLPCFLTSNCMHPEAYQHALKAAWTAAMSCMSGRRCRSVYIWLVVGQREAQINHELLFNHAWQRNLFFSFRFASFLVFSFFLPAH